MNLVLGPKMLPELYKFMVLRPENINKISLCMDLNYIKKGLLINWAKDSFKMVAGWRNRNNPMNSTWITVRMLTIKLDLKLFRRDIYLASGMIQWLSYMIVTQSHRDRAHMVDFEQVKCSWVISPGGPEMLFKVGSLGLSGLS